MLSRTLCFLFFSFGLIANPAFDLKHLEVSLRQLGHQILLSAGDSTSRVLPLEREANTFKLQFESDFSFEPERLVALSKQILLEEGLSEKYIIEVKECAREEVIYSFEIAAQKEQEIVPCLGREQLEACYVLLLTFPDLSDAHPQSARENGYWYLLFLVPLIGLPVFFLARKKEESPSHLYQIGRLQFNAASGVLSGPSGQEELTAKEGQLLVQLWEARNTALEREVLLHQVWGDEGDYVGRTLDVFISRLRKKLKSDSSLQILNVRGIGYKLIIDA